MKNMFHSRNSSDIIRTWVEWGCASYRICCRRVELRRVIRLQVGLAESQTRRDQLSYLPQRSQSHVDWPASPQRHCNTRHAGLALVFTFSTARNLRDISGIQFPGEFTPHRLTCHLAQWTHHIWLYSQLTTYISPRTKNLTSHYPPQHSSPPSLSDLEPSKVKKWPWRWSVILTCELARYFPPFYVTTKGPFIATPLNSTQLEVELSTRSQREQLSPISSERRDPVRVSIATQLNSTRRRVELCRYKRALSRMQVSVIV